MGIGVTISSYRFEVTDLTVVEDSTPLSGADSTGGVGSITFTLPEPDQFLDAPVGSGLEAIKRFGPNILLGKSVTVKHSLFGTTQGRVSNAGRDQTSGLIRVTCTGALDVLNSYNMQAQPRVGTLGDLFRYYFGLAGVTTSSVDPSLESRYVAAPGWSGELWYYLKLLCAAHRCEIAYVDGVITVRPNRVRYLVKGTEVSTNQETPIPTLARSVEVYKYNNVAITNQLVYPPGGWSLEVDTLNVNAGEQSEYTLELSSSISSFVPPEMVTYVSPHESSASVYTVIANDGLPISPALWAAKGGSVVFSIDPDTTRIHVKLKGATGIPTENGSAATNFSLALASDQTSNRYSTLRILGTGVSFNKQKKVVRTVIDEHQTATDIGVTIDNPFISDNNQLYSAGLRAASQYSGFVPTLSTTVLKPLGISSEQTYGNVNGSRVWDDNSARYYRVRTSSIDPATVQVSAEDDLTVGDLDEFFSGLTVGQVDEIYEGLTVGEVDIVGMRRP